MPDKQLPLVPYERDKHEAGLMALLAKYHGEAKKEGRQKVIDWIQERMPGYEQAPLRHVVVDGDRIAGTMGHLPTEFLIDGKRVPARFTHDLLVDPDYRGHGLAKRLVSHALETGEFFPGGMWMTGPCYQIHLACGFTDMPPLSSLTLALDPAVFLGRKDLSVLKRAAAKVALKVNRAKALKQAGAAAGDSAWTVRNIEQFDPALDDTWLKLLGTYGAGRLRNAAFLNWKYAFHPNLSYRMLLAERDGSAEGYLIWRLAPDGAEEKRAAITDFLVSPGAVEPLGALLSKVILDSAGTDTEAISVLSTQSWAVDLFRKFGFFPKGETDGWVTANWQSVLPPDRFMDPDQWHVCMGDSDGDIWTGSQ